MKNCKIGRVDLLNLFEEGTIRPWPNDSIFHSIFSSTFDLKVERLLSVVEHRWPNGSIFARLFSRLFNYSYFRNACQRKIFTITNI